MTRKEREEAIKTIERLDDDFGDYEPNHKVFENILSALKGFEGMTNGEVLKSIFPTAELMLGNSDYIPNVFSIKEDWWNAPYQKGGDDKECI